MTTSSLLQKMARPAELGGGYAMLAIDQRESLRNMFSAAADGADIADDVLAQFKVDAVDLLAEHSSAVLIDRTLGQAAIDRLNQAGTSTLILSADVLHQQFRGELTDSTLDDDVTTDVIRESGAAAIKMLVLWYHGESNELAVEKTRSFIERAQQAGVASLLEPVVRPARGAAAFERESDRHTAILDAARALSPLRPDIYKAQVPGYVAGDLSLVQEQSRKLTEIVGDVPWVVLSNGIRSEDFSEAVRLATRGGAEGFLAGRAIWADAVASGNARDAMASESVARLRQLNDIVAQRRS